MALGDILFTLRSRFDSVGSDAASKGLQAVGTAAKTTALAFLRMGIVADNARKVLRGLVALKVADWLNDVAKAGEALARRLIEIEYATGVSAGSLIKLRTEAGFTEEEIELLTKVLKGDVAALRELVDQNEAVAEAFRKSGLEAANFAAQGADQIFMDIANAAQLSTGGVDNARDSLADVADIDTAVARHWETFKSNMQIRFAELKDTFSDQGGQVKQALLNAAGISGQEWADLLSDPQQQDDRVVIRATVRPEITREDIEQWPPEIQAAWDEFLAQGGQGVLIPVAFDIDAALTDPNTKTQLGDLTGILTNLYGIEAKDGSAIITLPSDVGKIVRAVEEGKLAEKRAELEKLLTWIRDFIKEGDAFNAAAKQVAGGITLLGSSLDQITPDAIDRFGAFAQALGVARVMFGEDFNLDNPVIANIVSQLTAGIAFANVNTPGAGTPAGGGAVTVGDRGAAAPLPEEDYTSWIDGFG